MNTLQLYRALTNQHITSPYFDGVFARDTLEDIQSRPSLIICNTDPSSKSGKHWVLFFFENDTMEFFDSLGKDLHSYGSEFVDFAERFANTCKTANVRTQPKNTDLCGIYCLYYAFWRCQGVSMARILETMSFAKHVKELVCCVFKLCTFTPCKLLQSCCLLK